MNSHKKPWGLPGGLLAGLLGKSRLGFRGVGSGHGRTINRQDTPATPEVLVGQHRLGLREEAVMNFV